jgi:hypothetical protein
MATADATLALNRKGLLSEEQRKALANVPREGVAEDLVEERVESVPVDVALADDPEPARLYVARARGESTTLPMMVDVARLPGEHTAYVLPRSRLVIGLEPTGSAAAQLRLHRADMLRVQRVTEEDLRLSREKKLPDPKQRAGDKKRSFTMIAITLIVVVPFGAAAIAGFADGKPGLGFLMFALGAVMTAGVSLLARYGGSRDHQLFEGVLGKYESRGKGHAYRATVGEGSFVVQDPVVYALLVPGLRYRAHNWRSLEPTFEPLLDEGDGSAPYR